MQQTTDEDDDPELKVEVDADGYRVDHRSETEQSSQAKEVHEYPDRTEIRLRDEKEVRLEEVKTRETTRRATYDDMIALLDAQLEGLDEIQTSREVTIQEFNRVETTRETVTDGELKREIRTTDTKRKEEILEGPKDSKRVVTTETETLVMQPSPGGLSLEESESPRSQASDEYRTASSTERPSSLVFNPGHGIEPERGGFNVGVTPGEAEFRVRSEGFGGKTPEKTEREVIWIPKPGGNLGVKGDLNFAENTGSLHRIQHRAHRIEELIVEDVDTFYEDQTKPPKRHSGLLGVKKDKRGKSQSPPSTLEKRPKREDIKDQRLTIDVENVTPRSSPERPAQPAGVSITPLPRTDIVAQPDIQVDTGFEVKPRDVIVGPQDGSSSNSMTFVVTYDAPGGVNIRDSGKRKKDVHPKKKKDKRRFGKHQQETDHDMPAEAEFVTYVVNYDRTEPLDGDNKPPRPAAVIAKPEASLPEPSISREPRSAGDAAIEVDMNAGDVKVMEPARVVEERHGDSKTFVVNYEIPAVEKSAKPVKPKKELRKAKDPSYSGSRQPPDEEFTYIVNYDTPSVTPVVTPTSIETTVESPDADSDLEKKAPVYSITVVEPGPGVSVEKVTKSPEKPEKKKDKGSKDAVELTYIVNHGDPQQASLDDTDNLPGKVGGSGDVWIRPPKPAFEAEVRGKEDIKAEPAKLKVDPGNTEPLTFVVEYERGAEEKAKGGVPAPKLKKGKSPDDVVEKMYTYIVNYDQPSSRPLKKDKKEKKEKKGKDVKAAVKVEKPRIQKSHDIELPSKELSFTVQHPFPEPATKPEKPTSELSIAVQHPIPAPSFEVREQIQEYSITVDRPFPEPVTKPEEQFEEFSIAVEHPFPEPVTKPEERFEEFSIAVDHPFPEPAKEPEEQFEEFSIAIEHPFPEPPKEPEERFEEFSIEVDHPFPEPPKQPEEQFEEFSIAIEQPFPEPAKEPEEQFEEFSIAIEHPFPEPVREPEDEFEEFSISVDHPIPEAHLEIKEPVLPQPKLPAPIPSKGAGESLTYVVTYDTPTASGEGKPAKTKKKRKPLFSKGSKPSAKAEVATETSPDIAQTFTYVVNYDGPAVRPERPVEPKPSKTEVFGKADVKVPKPEIKTSVEIPGPKVTVGQSEELSITVAQPIPTISGATQAGVDISPPESAEGVTYIVHHEEPFAVVKTTEKPKKTHKKEAELKIKKPQLETKYEVDVLPEESAMPLPSSTLTYVVNYDQPVGKAEKVGGAKGKRGWRFEGKKPKAALEVDAPKVVVKTPVVTPKIPEPPAVSESISYTIVHDQPEPPEVGASIVTDGQWKPDSSEDMRFTVDYDLPLKTEQEDEVPEIEVEAPASIELISPSTEDVGLELRDIRQRRPPTPEIPHTDISVSIERPDIPAPALAIPATTGESRTYIVQYEEPRAKAIGKEKPEKVKTKGKGWAFQKKKPPASADIEAKGASLSTETYEVYVTTDQPKASVSAELPKGTAKVSAVKPTPTVTTPSKDVSTEQFTYIVNYDGGREVIPTPEIRDTSATIEVEAVDVPQIEPFEIREPEVDIEEPSSRLSITVEEPFTEVSAEFEPPAPEISFKVKEPVVPVVATPDVALRKEGAAETITYVVTHEDPAALKISGKVKPDKKEKKRGFAFPGKKKYYKDIKAGASFEAKGPEITTEIAGGVPLYEVTVKTEQPEPSVDVKKKKPEVSVTTPEAAILIPSKGLDVQVPTQPQSITYVVSYDDSEKAIPKSKLKKTTDSKRKDITAPKVKPPKAPKGKILSGEGESMTYVVTYDDTAKFIPPPQLEGSEELKIEVQNIPEIKSPEIPQAELDIEEPISELTITVGQPIPEIIEEVKPPTPEIKVKEPSEVEQLTITVEQPLPEISAEVKPPTPEVKIKNTTDSKRKDITAPKVKPPKAPKGKIISGEGESMTYVVTYDDAAKFIPPPQLEGSEELKIEVQNIPEIKSPEIPQAELDIEEPISELTITVGQPIPEISAEVKPPTPEIKVKEPSEVEQWTIRVEQPLPEISAEVKPPTPELKIRQPSGVEQLSITVEQPLPEVSREIKLPTPEVKVKKPAKVVVTPPSVTLPQTDSLQTFTYIVTHDEPTSKISGEAKPEKKEKKKRVFSFPAKKITKEVKIEGELEAKKPKAAAEVATGVPIYEVTVITEKPEAAAHVETKQPEVSIETPKPVIEGPSLTDVESFTYVVSYDDAGKVLLPEIKETVAIKVQREDIALEIPEAEVKLEEPSLELTISVEHPLPEVSAKVKAPTPEIEVRGPSKVVVGPPSVEIPQGSASAAETVTFIVTHEDPLLKTDVEAKPVKKDKKKRGFVFPVKKVSKDVKAGAGVKATVPEITAEIAEGVPLYEVSVTTEHHEPPVDVKKKKPKVSVTAPKAAISITKPSADTAVHEETQAQSITYVVAYDVAEKRTPPPAKKKAAKVEVETMHIPKITIPEKPEAKLQVEEQSSQLTITVEQPLPEISAEVRPPTPEVKIREPSEIEEFTITVEQPLPEISAEVKPPTPEVKIREPHGVEKLTITVEQPLPEISAEVKPSTPEVKIRQPSETEQFTITVEQPLLEVSTKVKPPIKDVKVKKQSEIVVGPPSVELSKGGTAETITYIVTQEDRPSKLPEAVESKEKEKKKKIHFPRLHFGKTYKVSGDTQLKDSEVAKETEKPKSKAIIKSKKPEIDLSKEEVVTYVVKYDDQSKAISAPEVKPPKIPESKIKLKEPSSELTITVEQPLPDISAEVKPPTPEIKVKQPSETEQFTITVEQPLPEINAKVKPPTPEVKIREPSEIEQFTITVEQPLPEISAEVKPPTPEVKIREPHGVEELTITVEQPLPEISAEVKPLTPEVKIREPSETEQFTITVEQPLPEITAEAKLPTPETSVKAPSKLVVKPPSVELPKTGAAETVTYIVNHEEPAVKTSGEVKVKSDKKETKQIGIRLPGKKVTKEPKAGAGVAAKGPTAEVTGEVPVYEVSVTTEQPESPAEPGVAAAKGGVIRKEGVETVTYVVEHDKEGQAKEGISAEGQKKRTDWIWRVKKPAKSIDISSDSQERSVGRIEPDAGISAKIEEPKLGISAEAETPGRDVSVSTGKAGVAPEISRLTGTPETHTYIVTYDEPHVTTTSKGKPKRRWPFSRREAPPGKLEVKAKPKKNKWTLFKKKEPKLVKPRVDIELAEIKPAEVTVGETIRGDIDVSVPAAPSIALEQKAATVGDILGTVAIPVAPDYSITITREELPSGVSVTAPRPELTISETGEAADLEAQAQQKKPTDVSQAKIDVEAKLPGRKEQVLAEKVISGRAKVAAGAEAEERKEPKDKDRSVITGGGGRREEENAEEETVVYIVNYEQPFGTLTKTKDAAKETPGPRPSTETAAETEKTEVTTKNVQPQVQVQMPQLEQCILVPIRDESSPEDRFYGTEAPVPAWPPVDIDGEDDDTEPSSPHFEEDIRSPDVTRQLETSTRSVDEKQLPPHLVVVAVDFGTTFSGYAFSFSRDSSGSIHVMRKWEGGDPGAVDHKTPTILLLTPGGQFHSFGFTARDFYHDLSPKEAARWLYFEKFKMALHFNDELNTDTKLAAANGQCVPAIDVFTHALRFFRKHVLQEVSDQVSTDVLNEDIYWIITVPAIWTEEAKQFMRLAAYRAGIASPNYPDQLLISLEPEAASIYVRKQRLHQLVPDVPFQRRRSCRRSVTPEPTAVNQPIVATERKVLPTDSGQLVKTTTTVTVSWPVVTTIPQTDITVGHQVDTAGSRYMVVDCGGGTVDITVHEIQSRDGTLKELHRATGGPFGSVAVDQEFEKLLVDIFGVDFIDVFKSKRPAGWVDLLMAFESRKRAANPYITKPLNVSLPFSFIDYHKKYRNCPVEHAIRKYNNRDIRWSSQGMLRLMPDAMNRLFLPAIDKIKEAIGNVLNDSEVKGLRFLFLVGGFADSPMLQLSIRQDFGHLLRIIIPNDASISILKGAVCFGLDPSVITTRKSRMTYGVGVLNRFVPGQHPQSKLILKDGEEWCTDVFDALVYADQSVAIGDTVLRRYTLVPGDADDVTVSKVVNIYSSDRRDVKYVTERGVTRCGTLCLTDDETKKPLAGRQDQKDREVQVRMTFGQTEIKVTAFELGTRKSVRATIDFLNK